MTKRKTGKSKKRGGKHRRDSPTMSKTEALEKVADKIGIGSYPPSLRGIATNKFGGNNLQRERGFKGGTYGPASPVYTYTEEERAEYERILREKGELE